MTDEMTYRPDFNICHVETQIVTLYPTRAQMVRDIGNITLRVYLELHNEKCYPVDNISLALTRSQNTA